MIIGFLGKKGSGKDTAVRYLVENYKYKRYAFGDPVKEVCRTMFNFSDNQLYGSEKEVNDPHWNITPRQAFQVIGTNFAQFGIYKYLPDLIDTVPHRSFWVKKFVKWYNNEKILDDKIKVAISDVRFIHEVDEIKKQNGIIIKLITNNKNHDYHISEKEIDLIKNENIDYTIENTGTLEELHNNIQKILDKIEIKSKDL